MKKYFAHRMRLFRANKDASCELLKIRFPEEKTRKLRFKKWVYTFSSQEVSMQLNQMTDLELDQFSVETAEKQRTITLLQLTQLNENERRRLYSKFNCSSLHEYCVKRLKMDDGTAGRYISAARLLVKCQR